MTEHICPSCHCAFKQEFLCTTCGADKLKNESTRQLERALHSKTEALMAQTNEIESLRQQLAECEREREKLIGRPIPLTEWQKMEQQLATVTKERDELHRICRDAYEVWAGSEGIPEPVCASEAYLYQLLINMRDEVKRGLAKLGADNTGEK